jgi:hypothetical protein
MAEELPLAVRVEQWRAKAREGTLTLEEQREAIVALRAGRVAAAQASPKRAAGSKATEPVNIDDLLI